MFMANLQLQCQSKNCFPKPAQKLAFLLNLRYKYQRAPIVQWIGQMLAEHQIEVRLLLGAQKTSRFKKRFFVGKKIELGREII